VKIAYFQPPAPQRVGGLDAAIQGLNAALSQVGIEIIDGATRPEDFDLGHFHGIWQPSHARVSARLRKRGIPYVVSPHGMLEPWAWRHKWWKKWPYFHFAEKRHLRGAAALLATGSAEARRLAHFAPRQRIETLPLGLTGTARPDYAAARRTLGWAPDELVLLYLSRLHIKKGADLLLRALARGHWPVVTRLVVVGDGDPAFVDSLRTFALREAAKLPRIDWVGAVWGDARWPYFQGADLFCLPTHSENFGLAVLESLQVGTPALTTTDTPWAEHLSGGHGYIARPEVDALQYALAQFFAHPRITAESRQETSDWAWKQFAWQPLASRYANFFRSVITGLLPES